MNQNTPFKFESVAPLRYILRVGREGRVKLAEDVNGRFVLFDNDNVVGVYANRSDAFLEFGRLTRES